MISRREFLGTSLGAGAALALTPELLRALQQSGGKLIQRAIPSSGEMLPVIGLQFGNRPSPDHAALKEVLKTLVDNGGRFLDTVHQSVPGVEDLTATIVTELGIQNKLFLASRASPAGPPQPGAATPKAQIETLLARFKVPKARPGPADPVQADPAQLAALKEMKKEGRVRYIGATGDRRPPVPAARGAHAQRADRLHRRRLLHRQSQRRGEDPAARPGAEDRRGGVLPLRRAAPSSSARAPRPFRIGPPSSTPRRGRSSSSSTSSATRPSPWSVRGRARRSTCSTTSAAASGACRTRRRGSAWRSSSTRCPGAHGNEKSEPLVSAVLTALAAAGAARCLTGTAEAGRNRHRLATVARPDARWFRRTRTARRSGRKR